MAGQGRLRTAGRVGRPHGLDGSFHVRKAQLPLGPGTSVTIAGVERRVERQAGTHAAPIVRLEGVTDRGAASALTGEVIHVRDDRAPIGEGEWLAADLIGCEVTGAGTVRRVIAGPSCDVLELDGGILVPLVSDAIESIDPAARRIEINRGFLGLS